MRAPGPVPFLFLLLWLATYVVAQRPDPAPYAEAPDPKPVDSVGWAALAPGHYVRFATADVRFAKHAPPAPANLRDTWQPRAWRGERVHTQVLIWSTADLPQTHLRCSALTSSDGATIPAERVSARFVRYVLTDGPAPAGKGCDPRPPGRYDSLLVADPIDTVPQLNVAARSTQPVWLSVAVPAGAKPGRYAGRVAVFSAGRALGTLPYTLTVLPRSLPKPADWAFHLDLWQHPYAVARVHNVPVWSDAHFALMKPYMKLLADAGQKVVTATIIHDPWQSQTEDVYGSMVRWIRRKDGTWAFDYTIFDRWVSFMLDLGIDRSINCYSMIPWNLTFYYHDEAARKDTFLVAAPGSAAYNAHWRTMLTDFRDHLKQKGWFARTTLAMDERPAEAMQQALTLIRSVDPAFRLSLAGNYHAALQPDLADYSLAMNQSIDAPARQHRQRAGLTTTFYTCCVEQQPNTFTFSPPAEATWLGWYAANRGYDGYLRWAYNSWVKDPLRDSRFRTWPAGDTFLVYPGPRSSIRFERLIEGIQDYEKIRILRQEFLTKNQRSGFTTFQQALGRFEPSVLATTSAADQVEAAKALLNSL